MKEGNWVPISKAFVERLPKDRKYTEIEAMFSLQVDYDNNRPVSLSGLASLWGWSRNKIRRFLEEIGVCIESSIDGKKKGQVKGQVVDRLGKKKGQVRFVYSKGFRGGKNRLPEKKGQKKDRLKDTTIYPANPNKEKSRKIFEELQA